MAVTLSSRVHAQEAKPRVIRTMTHHQVTAVENGIWGIQPVISDSGNKVVFGLKPAGDGQPYRLAAIDFDGKNLAVLDADKDIDTPDVTADGSRVVYKVGNEIRIVNADGTSRRSLFKPDDGSIICLRISGDGRIIVFLVTRGLLIKSGDKSVQLIRGVYAINPDGSNFHRVAGPDEIARMRGILPDEVGNPNFVLQFTEGSIDVSTNGARVIFGCWAKGPNVMMGCNTDGRALHTIAEVPSGDTGHMFDSVALSGDGSTVAYHTARPEELHVCGFDGKWDKLLRKQGPDDQRIEWSGSHRPYITLDGSRVTYSGRHFTSDGSGAFQLMNTHQEGVLRYLEYEQPAADAMGRRFAYFSYEPQPGFQLATMELNVPWDNLRGAPKISSVVIEPAAIPREQKDIHIIPANVMAAVTSDPSPPAVSATGFLKGVYDVGISQSGAVGQTDMFDNGKLEDYGDAKAGDGIYSRRWLMAFADAAEGPWTFRVEAQVIGADKLRHASVTEVGTFPIVPGSDKPSTEKGTTVDGAPPAPPEVKPNPAGTTLVGPTTTTDPTDATTTTTSGPIDLTGYWTTEDGAMSFMRQIGKDVYWTADALPRVRNIFMGTIDGDVLTGTWVDLPGGELETGTGTLKLKIVSNDKLTKISSSIAYGASTWIRSKKSTKPTVPGPKPTDPTVTGPGPDVAKLEPWQTPAGRALIDKWIAESMAKINAYDGPASFNRRKPYSINKYGLLESRGVQSVAAPDDFKDHGNDRYAYMWHYWVPGTVDGWTYPEWNKAGVPPLREYVMKGLAKK